MNGVLENRQNNAHGALETSHSILLNKIHVYDVSK